MALHDAWIQAPILPHRAVTLAREIGLGGLTLCALMPDTKGSLYSRYRPDDLRAHLDNLRVNNLRAGVMIWADTTPRDVDVAARWLASNRGALLACGLLEVDAEESFVKGSPANRALWVEMFAEFVVGLRADGWEGQVSVTATDWDLRHDRIDALIRDLGEVVRPQWYVFRKPGDEPHWSHKLGSPTAQIGTWEDQLLKRALPRIGRDDLIIEAGIATYWQRGVKGHDSIPSAMSASIAAARGSRLERGTVAWSLNWADARGGAEATARAAWAACLRDEDPQAVADNGAAHIEPEPMAPSSHGDRERVRELQRQLSAAGYNPGAADGLLGPRTRDALDRWAQDGLFAPDDWTANYPQINALAGKLGLLEEP